MHDMDYIQRMKDKEMIIALNEKGLSCAKQAVALGIDTTTIWRVREGKTGSLRRESGDKLRVLYHELVL